MFPSELYLLHYFRNQANLENMKNVMALPYAVHLVLFLGKKNYCDCLIEGILDYTTQVMLKAKKRKGFGDLN